MRAERGLPRHALTLIAAHDIAAGDEVTVDYAYWEADESWRLRAACRCAAADCRSAVGGADWRRADLRSRLMQYASPFIRRRIAALPGSG